MPIPKYQTLANKLFPLVNQELTKWMGQSNFISKHIPQIPVVSFPSLFCIFQCV